MHFYFQIHYAFDLKRVKSSYRTPISFLWIVIIFVDHLYALLMSKNSCENLLRALPTFSFNQQSLDILLNDVFNRLEFL